MALRSDFGITLERNAVFCKRYDGLGALGSDFGTTLERNAGFWAKKATGDAAAWRRARGSLGVRRHASLPW